MNDSKELLEATIKGLEEKLECLVSESCDELEVNEDDLEYELSMNYENQIEMESVELQSRDLIAEQIMDRINREFKIVEEEEE